jgi:hypothetical protein
MTARLTDAELIQRLRGIYTVPVNDGAGLLDGKDTYTETYPVSPICLEAADEIEKLQNQVATANTRAETERMNREQSMAGAARLLSEMRTERDEARAAAKELMLWIQSHAIRPEIYNYPTFTESVLEWLDEKQGTT